MSKLWREVRIKLPALNREGLEPRDYAWAKLSCWWYEWRPPRQGQFNTSMFLVCYKPQEQKKEHCESAAEQSIHRCLFLLQVQNGGSVDRLATDVKLRENYT